VRCCLGYDGITNNRQRIFPALVFVLSAVLTFAIFGSLFSEMLSDISAAGINELYGASSMLNIGSGSSNATPIGYIHAVVRFVLGAAPYCADIAVCYTAITLLRHIGRDQFSEDSLHAASILTKTSVIALSVTILAPVASNIFQVCFSGSITSFNAQLRLPIYEIVFLLISLLLGRLLTRSSALKTENDEFI